MTLKIPPLSGVIHRVVRGDTMSEIATKYKVDIDDIIRVNRMSSTATLHIGMDLVIPGAVRKTPIAAPAQLATTKSIDDKKTPIPTKTPTKTPVTVSEKT